MVLVGIYLGAEWKWFLWDERTAGVSFSFMSLKVMLGDNG
jgi:hypothetical protein